MKKILFVLVMLLSVSLSSKSQPLFWYSPTDIRAKWPNVEWSYGKWGDKDEFMTMSFTVDDIGVVYYFNGDGKSIYTAIIPMNQGKLQLLVELYNNRYVIVNSYSWKFYDSGALFLARLLQTEKGNYYFLWTLN
jgi:hypothetical protein